MLQSIRRKFSGLSRGYRKDMRGSMSIEFAMVITPFLMMLFGTVIVGLYFFVTFSLENAVEQAARQIRTGQAQLAKKTKSQFKADVCSKAPSFIDCSGALRVDVKEFGSFSSVAPPSCTDAQGDLVSDPADTAVEGAAGRVVLVVVCYEWKLAGVLPFLKVGSMNNGSALIQAATTFRTEPYS